MSNLHVAWPGSHWERLTCVVAAGEPRRFAFRPIPDISTWSDWEIAELKSSRGTPGLNDHSPAVITLFPGDVVKMFGRCNDDFHHAVYPDKSKKSTSGEGNLSPGGERISLVLKRAIARNGGQKGHGIAGQGRRYRRRTHSDTNGVLAKRIGELTTNTQRPRRRRR